MLSHILLKNHAGILLCGDYMTSPGALHNEAWADMLSSAVFGAEAPPRYVVRHAWTTGCCWTVTSGQTTERCVSTGPTPTSPSGKLTTRWPAARAPWSTAKSPRSPVPTAKRTAALLGRFLPQLRRENQSQENLGQTAGGGSTIRA
jgi:hypothetical protein